MSPSPDSESAPDRVCWWQTRRLRRLPLLLTVLWVELLALTLLHFGYGVFPSFGIALGSGALYLSFPTLVTLGSLIACRLRAVMRTLTASIADRRAYRFSLRSLLVMVLCVCIASAWYGYRHQRVLAEQKLLEGGWYAISTEGTPYTLGTGKPLVFEFTFASGGDVIDPAQNPKWWDIRTQRGTSHAIYRWEGARLHVIQAPEGAPRPISFNVRERDGGSTEYFLERVLE